MANLHTIRTDELGACFMTHALIHEGHPFTFGPIDDEFEVTVGESAMPFLLTLAIANDTTVTANDSDPNEIKKRIAGMNGNN